MWSSFSSDTLPQPMGWTSENVARDFNITRERVDELALLSHNRAEKAQREGVFETEIVSLIFWPMVCTEALTCSFVI
jgi:acetyl-CoA acetyltransferase